ncbi:class I SAM-dependent methyltransferase [Mesobacterium sp. TK19101]|uniref:Class I SAM-dependent methyltransferase n=1 Tax=Mesobacterium hydrothermale TaxID=3111907 RepID=A0ABU6HFQ1_9RHOB|nr:class I SAM-dependent methyltransferase [Mesobacterium sp. TK19101]MEC3860544.1 class I SAM-dependent methyltransferase [Mesobacterium sp. TK19101]
MWEARFDRPDYLFGTAPTAFLPRRADWFPKGATVLSVAEGEGRNAVWLAQQGLKVTGLENAPSALKKAHALARRFGVDPTFVEADVLAHDWPEAAFDIALGIFIQFAGPADRTVIVDGMKRAVKPGGLLILHGYTPKQIEYGTGGPRAVENMYTPDLLRNLVPGWTVELCDAYEDDLDEGVGHSGRSALIDFIARKPVS